MYKEWITHYRDYTVFKYDGKEYIICNKNETKEDWTSLFTYNEAIEYCNKLKDRYMPSSDEWTNLLCNWCRYYWFNQTFPNFIDWYFSGVAVGKKFSEDFYLPFSWYSHFSTHGINYNWIKWHYRCYSNLDSRNNIVSAFAYARSVMFNKERIESDYYFNTENSAALRCFKPIAWDYYFIK